MDKNGTPSAPIPKRYRMEMLAHERGLLSSGFLVQGSCCPAAFMLRGLAGFGSQPTCSGDLLRLL